MLIYEYKLDGNKAQDAAIDKAIRITQFIRNKCLRRWMDASKINKNDLQCYCAVLSKEYSFACLLNSQARQAADRAWSAISRFYNNCKNHKPGKKGYPQFQHDNRSVEYKTTGWKLEPDGNHITFTDGCGIGKLRMMGCRDLATRPLPDIKRVRLIKRADGLHGIPVIAVTPKYTTQDCSVCGTRVKKSLSVRTHVCPNCGVVLDRDHNAAINIREAALVIWRRKNKKQGTVGHTGTGS
jgi:transposase